MNINLITNSEVKSIAGDPGNFKVTLTNNPRYIDPEACTGCGDCTSVCPVDNSFRSDNSCNTDCSPSKKIDPVDLSIFATCSGSALGTRSTKTLAAIAPMIDAAAANVTMRRRIRRLP